MAKFIPGKIVKSFTTKNGREVVIRYPRWEDLDQMTQYINELSKEDTFITFSGEEISKKEEIDFLMRIFKQLEEGDTVYNACFIDDKLVGVSDVYRSLAHRSRGRHVATLGLTVANEFRGEGIGHELAKTVIEEAKKNIEGLKLITLMVYQPNESAIGLYKKLGFEQYGQLPEGVLYKGEYTDLIEMYYTL